MRNCAKACAIGLISLVGCTEATMDQGGVGGAGNGVGGAGNSVGGAGNGVAGAGNSAAGAPGAQCSDGSPLPTPIPARQKVTFNLRNDSSERRFIVQTGASCNAFGIQGLSGTAATDLVLGVSPISCNGQCGRCECDAAAPFASEILAIEPGGTHAIEWDASSYVSCQAPIPGCPEKSMTIRAQQAVAPGTYRALVPIATALPARCSPKGEAGRYTCTGGGLSGCVSLHACPLDKRVTVDFSVPQSGDIQVDVPIS